jgi:CelD/BcsL family acetyltransferase involved in cellulose biosynthesis
MVDHLEVPLTVDVIREAQRLHALVPEWRQLASQAARDELSLSPVWLLPWWRVFGAVAGRELRVVTLREGGRLVGLAPLCTWRAPLAPLVRVRRLEPMGTGEDEADEVCSEYTGFLAARGAQGLVADAFADALAAGALGPVDEVLWPALATDGDAGGQVLRSLHRAGLQVERTVMPGAPHIPLPARWDDYLAALSQDKRYVLRRALREFDAWSGGHHQVHRAETPPEVDEGLRLLRALHDERWSAAGKPGVFASPLFSAFLDGVAHELHREGALELLWLTVKGAPVAAAFNVIWDGRVHFYQAGRVMDVPSKVKPGVVLHAFAIQRAIEAGRREYDFLAGEARYKLDLALAVRPLVSVRATRPSLRLASFELARRLGRELRERYLGPPLPATGRDSG